MRPLTAANALAAWERGLRRDDLGRSLALLAVALPGHSAEELAALPIGGREAALAALRRASFGPRLDGLARCPECGASLEFGLDLDELTAGAAPPPAGERSVEQDGWRVRFRLPASADLVAAAGCATVSLARELLFARCVVEALREGEPVAVEQLPPAVAEAVGAAMEAADPLAELPLEIDCAACGHRWTALLDIGLFLWAEVSAIAQRLVYEVHALATAYGWSETEILAMSAVRRQRYLELLPSA